MLIQNDLNSFNKNNLNNLSKILNVLLRTIGGYLFKTKEKILNRTAETDVSEFSIAEISVINDDMIEIQ